MANIKAEVVTVVIPCWNAAAWLERAIRSVLAQTLDEIEVIVVDDGSTDGSVDVALAFEPRIRLLTGPNRGACAARNRGLVLANGAYVMFLDADDYIEPHSLASWLGEARQADLVLGPYVRERDGIREPAAGPAAPVSARSLLLEWEIGHFTPPCSVLWRTSFVRTIGGWAEDLRVRQDAELVVRAVLSGARVVVANEGLGIYVQHEAAGRVSQRKGAEVAASELRSFRRLVELLPGDDEGLRAALGRFFYSIARRAFVAGFDDIGSQSLREARNLGFAGHCGSPAHLLLASLFGLRAKTRLEAFVAKRSIHLNG